MVGRFDLLPRLRCCSLHSSGFTWTQPRLWLIKTWTWWKNFWHNFQQSVRTLGGFLTNRHNGTSNSPFKGKNSRDFFYKVWHWFQSLTNHSEVELTVERGQLNTRQEMLRQVIFPVLWENFKSYAEGRVNGLRQICAPHCRTIFAHFLYFSTFFMFGMSVGMAGPTLTDYLISFFENIDIIDALAWLLFTQSTFRFVGAIVAGFLVDR